MAGLAELLQLLIREQTEQEKGHPDTLPGNHRRMDPVEMYPVNPVIPARHRNRFLQ
jgi:hypothetical protein